jgi:hypothetical protein
MQCVIVGAASKCYLGAKAGDSKIRVFVLVRRLAASSFPTSLRCNHLRIRRQQVLKPRY